MSRFDPLGNVKEEAEFKEEDLGFMSSGSCSSKFGYGC